MSPVARIPVLILAVALLPGAVGGSRSAQAQPRSDYDAFRSYFDGLIDRRLFSLAETVCLQKFGDKTLSRAERGRYAIEFCRSLSTHAAFVGSLDEQSELFDKARAVVSDELGGRNDHPLQTTLSSQALLATAREVELLRLRFELDPLNQELRDRARNLSGLLVPQFENLSEQLREELRHAKPDLLGERLTPYQLRGVLQTVELRHGLLLLDRARLLDEFSPDRAEAIVNADRLLTPLAGGISGESATWQSQIALAEIKRFSGEEELAARLLNAMRNDNPPPEVLDAIVAQEVELLLSDQKFADAADLIRQHRVSRQGLNGQLSFLMSSALLELWKLAEPEGEQKLADDLLAESVAFVEQARSDGNVYWARRAERLIADVRSAQNFGTAAGELVRRGQMLYSAGKLAEAAEAYGKAFRTAADEAPTEAAAELGYTAGSLLLQVQKFEAAAAQFKQLVAEWPQWKKAPDAHLLQSFALGMLYRQQPTAERREAYTAELEAHVEQFPQSPTAGDALWMQAELDEQRLQTSKALQLYARIPVDHSRGLDAQVAVARCGEIILDRLRKLGRSRADWEAVLIPRLATTVQPFVRDEAPLQPAQAELALRTARILLRREQPDFNAADQLLVRVITGSPNPVLLTNDPAQTRPDRPESEIASLAETRQRATGLRVVSLAGLGEMEAARKLLEEAARNNAEQLPQLLDGLLSAADGLEPLPRRQLGELQLRVIELLKTDVAALPESQRANFLRTVGNASELAGRTDVAVQTFERLLELQPGDAELRRRTALICREIGTIEFLAIAKPHWQKLEAAEKPGSVAWLELRLELLRTMISLKERDEARKLLKVTRLLYPELGGSRLKTQYGQLDEALR